MPNQSRFKVLYANLSKYQNCVHMAISGSSNLKRILSNELSLGKKESFNYRQGITDRITNLSIDKTGKPDKIVNDLKATIAAETAIINNKPTIEIDYLHLTGCKKLTTLCKYSLANNSFLISIILPKSTKIIDDNAVAHCVHLREVSALMCTKLRVIGSGAFEGCAELEELNLSNCKKLKEIRSGAFEKTKMKRLVLPVHYFKGKTENQIEIALNKMFGNTDWRAVNIVNANGHPVLDLNSYNYSAPEKKFKTKPGFFQTVLTAIQNFFMRLFARKTKKPPAKEDPYLPVNSQICDTSILDRALIEQSESTAVQTVNQSHFNTRNPGQNGKVTNSPDLDNRM